MTTTGMDLTPEAVEERARTAMRLTLAGESAREIAVRLGKSRRTVGRYRARMRLPAQINLEEMS